MKQEESEQNEVDGMKKGADSTGEVMHITMTVTGHCDKCGSGLYMRITIYKKVKEQFGFGGVGSTLLTTPNLSATGSVSPPGGNFGP